jgi:hypothetical protein
MLDLIELGRFHVEEHPSAPHARLSCNHLLLLCYVCNAGDTKSCIERITAASYKINAIQRNRLHFFTICEYS